MLRGKGFAGCEVIGNGSCGLTKYIGHNGIQSHIADGKRILKTVLFAALHRDQLITVAGKPTQHADIQVWDEAAFYKANAKQITDPLGIFRVILVFLYSLYPFGVGNYDPNTAFFKDVEYRAPIFPSGFHTDIPVVLEQPISKMLYSRLEIRPAQPNLFRKNNEGNAGTEPQAMNRCLNNS